MNVFREARRVAGMTEKEFNAQMERLLRRWSLLRDVANGATTLRRITVVRKTMTWTVTARTKSYVRYVAPPEWNRKRADHRRQTQRRNIRGRKKR